MTNNSVKTFLCGLLSAISLQNTCVSLPDACVPIIIVMLILFWKQVLVLICQTVLIELIGNLYYEIIILTYSICSGIMSESSPARTKRWNNSVLMLDQRHRRWPSIKAVLIWHFVQVSNVLIALARALHDKKPQFIASLSWPRTHSCTKCDLWGIA